MEKKIAQNQDEGVMVSRGTKKVKITTEDQKRSYADLPMLVLSLIADRVTPMDLLSFHGTCKDFRSASSPKLEFSTPPWVLFQNTETSSSSRFIGYDKDNTKTYYANIPDVKFPKTLAPCLCEQLFLVKALPETWVLLLKDKSLTFFRYQLRGSAKLLVPDFPYRIIYDNHVAAFSDAPTSPDCVVCIFYPKVYEGVTEISMICQNQRMWTQHKVHTPLPLGRTDFAAATFNQESQTFYYIDNIQHYVLKVSAKNGKWAPFFVEKIDISSMVPYGIDFPFPAEVLELRISILQALELYRLNVY